MHKLEKTMVEFGAIDTAIDNIQIDDFFENLIITFTNPEGMGRVVCQFEGCVELSLRHDKAYSRNNYKYFIQEVEVVKDGPFYAFKLSAWPLNAEIVCKDIYIGLDREKV